MYAGQLITFETPKRYMLQGLWLGTRRPRTVYIFVHGLCSNLFAQSAVAEILSCEKGSAAILFNNRGNGYVSKIRKWKGKKLASEVIGGSHEVFAECRDDIAGAVAHARSRGAKRIVLVGHSTGSQKSAYYLASKPDAAVIGAVLLAPLSDYAGVRAEMGETAYRRALRAAKNLVARGKLHDMLPVDISPMLCDAQRWLSLYTPESAEEIFSYASAKAPTLLSSLRAPLRAVFSKDDQYADRPASKLAAWFAAARPSNPITTSIVPSKDHGFSGHAEEVAKIIRTAFDRLVIVRSSR